MAKDKIRSSTASLAQLDYCMLKRITIIFSLFVCFVPQGSAASAYCLRAKLDQHIQSYIKEEHFQGSVLIAQNGEILFKSAYGYADIENKIK